MLQLRPYQRECIDAIRKEINEGRRRQLVTLPTGAGKTVVFASLIAETGARALILAHTTELLQQAKDKIGMIDPALEVGIVGGGLKEIGAPVTVASIQSARQDETIERLIKERYDLIIIDEAHHAASESYRYVLHRLGAMDGKVAVVGFTATPFRSDEKGLGEIFEAVTYERTIKDMIQEGYLCQPKGVRVATDLDLSKVKSVDGDYSPSSLASVMDTPEMRALLIDTYQKEGKNRKAICFGVTVGHASRIAEDMITRGIKAGVVYGEMRADERKDVIAQYQKGALQALCNCAVLAEGFDAPETDCVIVARPTKAKGLYQQMVGRGLRLYPNKKDCLVIDFNDRAHSLCGTAELLMDGEDTQELHDKEEHSDSDKRLPPNLNQKLKSALIGFDPLGETFTWTQRSGVYTLRGAGLLSLEIHPDGECHTVLLKEGSEVTIMSKGLSFEYAFATAEDFARANRKAFSVSDRDAEWRNLPATEKQIAFIRSHRYTAGIDQLTRGQAADLISSGALRGRAV